MLHKMKIAIVAALLVSSATAALARPTFVPTAPYAPACVADEGYGRTTPCDGGN
jgi:hypothetical protein